MEPKPQKYATQTLPADYVCVGTVDIFQQKGLALALNLVGLFLFIAAYAVLLVLIAWVRGVQNLPLFEIGSGQQVLWVLLWGLIYIVVLVVLHEAAHGLFFRIYTGVMPKFAYKFTYAYAAAPDWYIRRNAYRVVAMAPIFLLSGSVVLLSLIVPINWVVPLIMFASLNIASAVGDLYVYLRLLRLPENAYIKDEGDRMAFYTVSIHASTSQEPLSGQNESPE